VIAYDEEGKTLYETFNRYDFLERDESGEYYWNDMFLFSCDTSAPLASNREAMWQEMRMNLQTGAFGDPASFDALILFWGNMEQLHYPCAGKIKAALEEQRQRQMVAQMQQQQMMQQRERVTMEKARQDAARAALAQRNGVKA
jgi:hypothetical protein